MYLISTLLAHAGYSKNTLEEFRSASAFRRKKQLFFTTTNFLHQVQFLGKADARHPLVKFASDTLSQVSALNFRPDRYRHTLQKRLFNEREDSVGILFLDDSS